MFLIDQGNKNDKIDKSEAQETKHRQTIRNIEWLNRKYFRI